MQWIKRKTLTKKSDSNVAVSLVLISTTTMIGHGAASGQTPALVLDYIHNLVAAVWIGGIFYFVFTLLPTFSQLKEDKQRKMSLVLIPRFSIAFIISVGVVIITGPTLMWFLESDVGLILNQFWPINYSKNSNCCNYDWVGRILPIQSSKKC